MTWTDRVQAIGLHGEAASRAVLHFEEIAAAFARHVRPAETASAWWVPGRIEVLGKHTDYGGGRSLLAAVARGFHVLAAPRPDPVITFTDTSTGATTTIALAPDQPVRPGHWTNYPISVARRIARDFPSAHRGAEFVVRSSLPSASGMSSSSALVIATFLPLAEFNRLEDTPEWQMNIPSRDALAEYLGAVENGRAYARFLADHGVGTQGGAEDQTAILQSEPGRLLQYRFIPVTREAVVDLPRGWRFVVAMSGVAAAKGGAAQARYNALSAEITALQSLWVRETGHTDGSLFAALGSAPEAADRLAGMLRRSPIPAREALLARLEQFRAETMDIIPGVVERLRAHDVAGIGSLVDRSQRLAESALRNQIPATSDLVRSARNLGAAAASAFGAGFGGSVWALVEEDHIAEFLSHWRDGYHRQFPECRARSSFFATDAAPSATRLPADG